ncbi:hypothetical protein EMCRGX_G011909 [Ephydatia muelleri]
MFCVNRAHLGVPWRIGEKEKAMEIDRLHEDEVLSLSWIRLTRGTANSFGYQNTSALGVVIYRLTLLDIQTPVRLAVVVVTWIFPNDQLHCKTIETVEWMQSIRPLLWWSMLLRGYGDRSANRRRENKGLNRIVYCDAICIVSNKISMPKKEVILMP